MRNIWRIVAGVALAGSLAACGRGAMEPESDVPTLDVTGWTKHTELFMEYPPLVGGQTALFAVHLTRLSDFSAMTAGRPRLEFTPESGGAPAVLQGDEASRPGVFRVEAAAPAAGRYRWALVVEAPDLSDRHDLGAITVFADEASAVADAQSRADENPAAITYLKEQQWTNGFATAAVEETEVRASLRAPATVHPLPGGEAIVAAPAAGRFRADMLLSIGDRVRAGQTLGWLEPRLSAGADRATLEAEVAEARALLEGARVEQTRAERLLAARAVPARRLEDAQRATVVAEARLGAAEARLAQRDETLRTGGGAAAGNAFALRAPIAGRLAEVMVTLGASYDEGVPLFRVVRTDRVELEVQVAAPDVPMARQAAGLALEIPGLPQPVTLEPRTCTIPASSTPRPGRYRSRWKSAIQASNCWLAKRAPRCCTCAIGRGCRLCPVPPCSWKPGGRTCSCRSGASGSRGGLSRSPHATAISSVSRAASRWASASSRAGPTTCSWRRLRQGCRPKATFTEVIS